MQSTCELPAISFITFYILFDFLEIPYLLQIYICGVKYSEHLLIFFNILFGDQTAFIVAIW